VPGDAIERAVALAAATDVAIVCVGFGGEWQSEGFDRPDLALPGKQDALVEQVAAANPRTIVVLNTGSPISMPWLEQVAAVVQAWYPGQECGHAIADVLFGDTNPSGKLPQTFPQRLEDTPTYLDFPGENGKVYYGEGLFVGYRYYEKKKIAPLFPFGFGLSYTTFAYSTLSLSAQEIGPDDRLQVSVDITNTGQRAGKEIVQMYIRDQQASLQRPEKELKAFAKVQLEPGERKTVTLSIGRDALAYYDDLAHEWVAEAGEFEVLVGSSSQEIQASAMFALTTSSHWHS
jgi:beta-glucosidase